MVAEIMGGSTKWATLSKACFETLGIIFVALILIFSLYIFFNPPSVGNIASLAFLLGGIILVCGYYHLIYVLPRMTKDMETRLSMEALRVSFWLVIFGLIMIVLGILYLMNLLPPGWRT